MTINYKVGDRVIRKFGEGDHAEVVEGGLYTVKRLSSHVVSFKGLNHDYNPLAFELYTMRTKETIQNELQAAHDKIKGLNLELRAAIEEERTCKIQIGAKFTREHYTELFILALVDTNTVNLINLDTGNRWTNLQQKTQVSAWTVDKRRPEIAELLAGFTLVDPQNNS